MKTDSTHSPRAFGSLMIFAFRFFISLPQTGKAASAEISQMPPYAFIRQE
jgi:hypothetical protein